MSRLSVKSATEQIAEEGEETTDRQRQTAAAVDNIMKNWRIGMQRMAEIEYVEEDAVLSPAYIDVTTMPLRHRLHDISDHIVMKILNALIPNFQSPARPRRYYGGTRSRIPNNHA